MGENANIGGLQMADGWLEAYHRIVRAIEDGSFKIPVLDLLRAVELPNKNEDGDIVISLLPMMERLAEVWIVSEYPATAVVLVGRDLVTDPISRRLRAKFRASHA